MAPDPAFAKRGPRQDALPGAQLFTSPRGIRSSVFEVENPQSYVTSGMQRSKQIPLVRRGNDGIKVDQHLWWHGFWKDKGTWHDWHDCAQL